ncbi:Hydrogenase maturation protein HydE [Ignavibacterium album JCM 16511]|uniref:Hydrogenase maturation protein HydE n=1 Tax=Ignavibacterium album (strain DSM 19864 / JCM 16511 / NBRC 101810 / Mat9-16) TaxID=945713 RepID=I0AGY0_IGNAJ|nr:[FeFe] hydrogenase H-cluster radical SAM maturase HydE [Ignavibacterium album]AFH48237.1 Hydrogenase maturation protein HydE [Ignavibacterium album JCM 16511]
MKQEIYIADKKNLSDVLNKPKLNKDDIIYLLNLTDEKDISELIRKADSVRKEYCGDEVHLRGIIEFSNYCEQDCLYCGLRKSNHQLERYRISPDEIIETARKISSAGIKTVVLQSGEDFYYKKEVVTNIIRNIKAACDVAITLSLGERNFDEYYEWKSAGADRYLLKHETANEKLYSALHSHQKLEERLTHLKYLKSIGFQAGSGNIIGLPGQTIEDIADDILLCKEFDCDMCSFSPFIPSPETPMKSIPPADLKLTLKTMAVARIVLKNVHIPATTALSTLSPEGRKLGLTVGANVIMPNFTPDEYKDKYRIYANKKTYDPVKYVEDLKQMIHSMGRKIGTDKGHSLKKNY